MRIKCTTYFDITATGITGHFKASKTMYKDGAGQLIQNESSWNIARNQQRNWETIIQIIGMRAQIFKVTDPVRVKDKFEFEFEVETLDAYGSEQNPLQYLLEDANGVPMITGLWNIQSINPTLTVSGSNQNIWFTVIN